MDDRKVNISFLNRGLSMFAYLVIVFFLILLLIIIIILINIILISIILIIIKGAPLLLAKTNLWFGHCLAPSCLVCLDFPGSNSAIPLAFCESSQNPQMTDALSGSSYWQNIFFGKIHFPLPPLCL